LKTTGSDYLRVASSRTINFFYKIWSHFFSPTKKHIHLPYKLNHKWYFPNFLKTFPILVNAFVMAHKCTNRVIHCIYTTTRRQAVCQDNLINYRLADPKISFLKWSNFLCLLWFIRLVKTLIIWYICYKYALNGLTCLHSNADEIFSTITAEIIRWHSGRIIPKTAAI